MKVSEALDLYSNLYKSLDLHSNLYASSVNQVMQNAMTIENMAMKYSNRFEGSIASLNWSARLGESLQSYYYDSINNLFTKVLRNFQDSYQGSLDNIVRGFENIQKSQIEQLGSVMQAWESNLNMMSNGFLKSYNSMMISSMESLISGIVALDPNKIDIGSLRSLRIDEFITELNNAKYLEFDEELEDEIDLQEIELMIDSKIGSVYASARNQDGDVVSAINYLTDAVIESKSKNTIKDTIVAGILLHIILFILNPILNFIYPQIPSHADYNHIVKSTKEVVRVMELDYSFYNNVRIVVKDGLEVRRTSSMKSGTKYYLDFGDLVKIEHKSKNWTKISYTNVFTEERETGWVLTRYIKRLD